MAKQTLVFESPIELTLKGGMIVITDRKTGEITMRSLEDVQMVMVDNHSVRLSVPLLEDHGDGVSDSCSTFRNFS